MPRLSRAESQARTRDLLITTARRLFLTEGYLPISVETVAEEAGFSRGAVYSNFGSKERLCLAVLEDLYAEETATVVALLGGPGTLDERIDALEQWVERKVGEPGWSVLSLDFAAQSRHDPELSAALEAQFARIRTAVTAMLEGQLDQLGISAALPPEALATALVGLVIGVGVQRMLEPNVSARVVTDTLRALLRTAPTTRMDTTDEH
jgi:AcrR family transcriptional regulator